jgi:hypothetical protein
VTDTTLDEARLEEMSRSGKIEDFIDRDMNIIKLLSHASCKRQHLVARVLATPAMSLEVTLDGTVCITASTIRLAKL